MAGSSDRAPCPAREIKSFMAPARMTCCMVITGQAHRLAATALISLILAAKAATTQ